MEALTARVRLVRTPDGQRLDIPAGFTLGGDEALLRSESGRLVVEPLPPRPTAGSLTALLERLEDIDEEWPDIEDLPPDDVHL